MLRTLATTPRLGIKSAMPVAMSKAKTEKMPGATFIIDKLVVTGSR